MGTRDIVLASLLAASAASPALAQTPGTVTSVVAGFLDPNGKVPRFDVVPGAGIGTWSTPYVQGLLTQGTYYSYCVTFTDFNFTGNVGVAFKISRGKTVIQSVIFIKPSKAPISPGIWAYCSPGYKLPASPGEATLTGTVTYSATGVKTVATKLATQVLLQ